MASGPRTRRSGPAPRASLASCLIAVWLVGSALPAGAQTCSQPLTSGPQPTATDCLFILQVAVSLAVCDPACVCGPKGTLPPTATDALLCLQTAVGQDTTLSCPCQSSTTTSSTSSTSSTSTSSTSTSTVISAGAILQGVLPPTTGRFNYDLVIGLPGADAACNTQFPGTHACTFDELQGAQQAGDLAGVEDTEGTPVTSFWAIDPARPDDDQCTVSVAWDYQTVHTGQFADRVDLDNGAGTLGSLMSGTVCSQQSWVGCCE